MNLLTLRQGRSGVKIQAKKIGGQRYWETDIGSVFQRERGLLRSVVKAFGRWMGIVRGDGT